ncbi:MAG: hypothetical protein FJX84_07400 [Bacteroidetes bacterium]|nr:hypothetical protein [Bacteroidota bacterium]
MFTNSSKRLFEKLTLYFGITAFLIHSAIIFALRINLLDAKYFPDDLFGSPFAALFSPFSSLLVYEVYLLIYYLRQSYTKSVAKQLEIMALILLRNCFKDIGQVTEGKVGLLESELVKDLSGFVILLILVWFFYHLDSKRIEIKFELTASFVKLKKRLSEILLIIFIVLSIYSFSSWLIDLITYSDNHAALQNPSHIFYTEFFTLLTFVDVLLLLSSAKNLQNTILVIRNSGYVLATFLTRVSFSLDGWERIMAIVLGASVAVFMLWISRRTVFVEDSMKD